MDTVSNEVAFYRTLSSAVIRDIENSRQRNALDLSEVDDKDGRLQLIIRTRDKRKDLAVLNFSGSAPFLHFGGAVLQLQVIGPDDAIVRDKRIGVGELSKLISARITEELSSHATQS